MKLVVLDLDETLVFADEALYGNADYNVGPYGVKKRPYVDQFITDLRSKWELGIWTSSGSEYGPQIVEGLGIPLQSLQFLWTGSKCVRKFDPETHEYKYIKDLRKVCKLGYSLSEIVMVDDSPEKLVRNYGNLVCVRSWTGDSADTELLDLAQYLVFLNGISNITKVEKRGWQTVSRNNWKVG